MALKSYSVGLVVSAKGITDPQSHWITKTLRWIAKAMNGSPITVYVAGITTDKKNNYGLPRGVTSKPLPPNCYMVLLPGTKNLTRAAATQARKDALEVADEVWCLPCSGQSGRLSKTRPAMSFWLGVSGCRANLYKWVPPWVDSGDSPKHQQKKELPWISK